MISVQMIDAGHLPHTLYHTRFCNADGTATRARVNGKVKRWKREPGRFRVPMKYGMKSCFYLHSDLTGHGLPASPTSWLTFDRTEYPATDASGQVMCLGVLADWLDERGRSAEAEEVRRNIEPGTPGSYYQKEVAREPV